MSNPIADLTAALADRYRIERELGVGGMATVYLAHDIKHDRNVAIKVLRPELAAVIGADRFLSEIKTTANLQHPHILPLFDSGAVNGTVFYVMPFVDGETLRDRLTREKQLPVSEAVGIAREVASALDYAHRGGIIHRDIKPENILLHDRRALVADFGIALAAKSADQRMTETGMSLGTPQYMSPEQAMGDRELDARSDVFALGCVAYEMLVGEPPFTGPTAQAIVAKIITEHPQPPSASRRSVPAAVDFAVLTALEKLPADRWASADEFARALAGENVGGRAAPSAQSKQSGLRLRGVVAIAAFAALGAAALGWYSRGDRAAPLVFGQSISVTSSPGLEVLPAISPDGRGVAYAVGTWNNARIFVRPVSGGRALALTNDSASVQSVPSWSPDGARVMFIANGAVYSAPASGGTARQEVPVPARVPIVWAAWAPDGKRIAYAMGDSLMLRDTDGRSRRLAIMLEPSLCNWSTDGARIACASGNATYAGSSTFFANLAPSRIVICHVDDGALHVVSDSTSLNHSPVWSPDGRWIYFVSNRFGTRDVYGQHVTRGGDADGDPVRLTTGLNAHSISMTPDGKQLAYALLEAKSNVWSMLIPSGRASSLAGLTQETFGSQTVEGVTVSFDGQWLYFDSNLSGNADLYRARLPQGEQEQLTFDPSDEFAPVPSPNGREVAFHSFRTGSRDVFLMPLDGGAVQSLTNSPMQEAVPIWKPDGSAIAFMELTANGGIWTINRNADGTWANPVKRYASGMGQVWSRDGKWLAFVSEFGGKLEIMPADAGEPRVLIDPARPGEPKSHSIRFSADGGTLFVKSFDDRGQAAIWSIPVSGGTPQLRVLFDDPNQSSNNSRWDVSANRFYFTIDDWQSDIHVLDVVRN